VNSADRQFDSILTRSCALTTSTTDYIEWGEKILQYLTVTWSGLATSPVPSASDAYDALARQMRADGDLAPEQVDHFLNSWFTSADTNPNWLRESAERLLLRLRPWFALWVGFIRWVLTWSQCRKFDQVVFLGRDGLPLYAAACGLQFQSSRLQLRVADVPRSLLESPLLKEHLAASADFTRNTAVVDSGCYGTAVTRVVKHVRDLREDNDSIAVMFFASRNPRIFGYLNQLMSWHYLADCSGVPDHRGPFDFTIYACDVLESLPKPYRIVSTGTQIHREPTDFASFVLSLRIYAELARYARLGARGDFTEAARSASELYSLFTRPGTEQGGVRSLLTAPAPKAPPTPPALMRLGITGIAPQSDVFGIDAG